MWVTRRYYDGGEQTTWIKQNLFQRYVCVGCQQALRLHCLKGHVRARGSTLTPLTRSEWILVYLKPLFLEGVQQPKKSPHTPGNALFDALPMWRFQNFAADAAKKKTARFKFLIIHTIAPRVPWDFLFFTFCRILNAGYRRMKIVTSTAIRILAQISKQHCQQRHLGNLTAANWVSFDFNVSYSSCWGYSLINTLKLNKNSSCTAAEELQGSGWAHQKQADKNRKRMDTCLGGGKFRWIAKPFKRWAFAKGEEYTRIHRFFWWFSLLTWHTC